MKFKKSSGSRRDVKRALRSQSVQVTGTASCMPSGTGSSSPGRSNLASTSARLRQHKLAEKIQFRSLRRRAATQNGSSTGLLARTIAFRELMGNLIQIRGR